MYEHISLGSNCSITHQLEIYGLRTRSYPFDWARVTCKQLIKVLESNFLDYSILTMIKYSSAHSSLLIGNKYLIQFAHEILSLDQLDQLELSFERRVRRFQNLIYSNNLVRFYRIELAPVKNNIFIDNANNIVKLLEKYTNLFVLVILIQKDSWELIDLTKLNNKVKLIHFETFDPDWKMDQIDWNKVFNLYI